MLRMKGKGHCRACDQDTCTKCMGPWDSKHTKRRCSGENPEKKRAEDEALTNRLIADKKWRSCPQCGLLIERNEGCNHMRCRCGREFCKFSR